MTIDTDKSLDDLLEELAEVQWRFLRLQSDTFSERFELQKHHDALREQTARFARDWDLDGGTADLSTESASLRELLHRLDRQMIDVATRREGGTVVGEGDGRGVVQINQGMDTAQGAGDLHAGFGCNRAVLADRGIDRERRSPNEWRCP